MHNGTLRLLGLLMALCVGLPPVWGDQATHQLPNEVRQRQVWFGDAMQGYIVSGCLPTVPGSGLTASAFACEAYAKDTSTNELLYVGQASAALGPLNAGNGTYWLIGHQDRSTAVSGWTRQTATRYLWQLAASQPPLPPKSVWLAKLTVAGGNITAVTRPPGFCSNPVCQWFHVKDPVFNAPVSPTDATSQIQAAIAAAGGAGNGVVHLGDAYTYRISSTLDVTLIRELRGQSNIEWNGAAGGTMIDAANNSGFSLVSGGGGEMILRCDTPVVAGICVKLGGGSAGTFQSTMRNIAVIGASGGGSFTSYGIYGGGNSALALNDGHFDRVRVDTASIGNGFDIGVQFAAPTQRWYGGMIRVTTSGTGALGVGVNLGSNARLTMYGTVFSIMRGAFRFALGMQGLICYSCWFEGIDKAMNLWDSGDGASLDWAENAVFQDCLFQLAGTATHLFDLARVTHTTISGKTGVVLRGGQQGRNVQGSSLIALHATAPNPLIIEDFDDTVLALTFSGSVKNVYRRTVGSVVFGGTSAATNGFGRLFTQEATLSFGASLAAQAVTTQTMTVTGLRLADNGSPNCAPSNGSIGAGIVWNARVSADATITVQLVNPTAGAVSLTDRTWRCEVLTH